MTNRAMKVITINIPFTIIEFLDEMVEAGISTSRSELMRMCVYHSIPALLHRENQMMDRIQKPKQFEVEEFESESIIEVNGKTYHIPPRQVSL